jgi:hypothetical protein
MKKNEKVQTEGKKRLVLRKDSIRALDSVDLLPVGGGNTIPPDGGPPPQNGL